MIDNFELIKSLFYFNEANDMFFHLQIVQRAKDHKGENKKVKESAIKTYFIRSREHLDRVKVLKIYSRACGPCKTLENNLQLAGIPHESIDVQSVEGYDVVAKYEVRTVPTLILVDDEGNVVKRHSGLLGVQELKEFCNEAN